MSWCRRWLKHSIIEAGKSVVPYLQKRMKSFAYALRGVAFLISSQPHARIHLAFTLAVIAGGFFLNLERLEWCLLIIAIMLLAALAYRKLGTAVQKNAADSEQELGKRGG